MRVLDRRIDRWVRAVAGTAECDDSQVEAGARQAARQVARDLVAAGAIDDAAFAAGRVRSLARAGRSRRAIAAHLAAKGVPNGVAVLPDDPAAELAAALAYARRRRIGPFRAGEPPAGEPSADAPPADAPPADAPPAGVPPAGAQMKDLARMARAGFTQGVAAAALRMDADAAEALMIAARLK